MIYFAKHKKDNYHIGSIGTFNQPNDKYYNDIHWQVTKLGIIINNSLPLMAREVTRIYQNQTNQESISYIGTNGKTWLQNNSAVVCSGASFIFGITT
jgi:hypothetical protein